MQVCACCAHGESKEKGRQDPPSGPILNYGQFGNQRRKRTRYFNDRENKPTNPTGSPEELVDLHASTVLGTAVLKITPFSSMMKISNLYFGLVISNGSACFPQRWFDADSKHIAGGSFGLESVELPKSPYGRFGGRYGMIFFALRKRSGADEGSRLRRSTGTAPLEMSARRSDPHQPRAARTPCKDENLRRGRRCTANRFCKHSLTRRSGISASASNCDSHRGRKLRAVPGGCNGKAILKGMSLQTCVWARQTRS